MTPSVTGHAQRTDDQQQRFSADRSTREIATSVTTDVRGVGDQSDQEGLRLVEADGRPDAVRVVEDDVDPDENCWKTFRPMPIQTIGFSLSTAPLRSPNRGL